MTVDELKSLYRRFFKWWNDNVDFVDFEVVEREIEDKDNVESMKRLFNYRQNVINDLLRMNYFSDPKREKIESLKSGSYEGFDIRLSLLGY